VVGIRAVSVVKEAETPSSPPQTKQPRHWYFLWLASSSGPPQRSTLDAA
jgi:hypothetical protein